MSLDHESRRLAWDGCLNVRDLGGLPTASGEMVRRGAVVRSDGLDYLTESGRQALLDHGVRTIVDLRLPGEAAEFSYPLTQPGPHGINYQNLSFIDPDAQGPAEPLSLAEDYEGMLDRFRERVGAILKTIAEAPEGGVLIHCAAGKDRTGLISALLLDLVGVPREIIAADYGLSSANLRPRTEEWLATAPELRAQREADVDRNASRPEVMLEVLDWLDHWYGGIESYFEAAGLRPEEVERLRERLMA